MSHCSRAMTNFTFEGSSEYDEDGSDNEDVCNVSHQAASDTSGHINNQQTAANSSNAVRCGAQ
jgi:hypothetical protein